MAVLLCLETSTEVCSVVISKNGGQIAEAISDKPMSHASQLTLLIEACCQKSDYTLEQIDGISVSHGPGSFTALRIGLSTAKGIAYALEKPLITIPSLLIQANGAKMLQRPASDTILIPMIDARRMEVYTAIYDQDLQPVIEPRALILSPEAFDFLRKRYRKAILCGNGSTKAKALFTDSFFDFGPEVLQARFMTDLAEQAWSAKKFADLAYVEPFYLKAPNITTPKKVL